MSVTLVDSSVVLDVVTRDPRWYDWSSAALARSADSGMLAINPIIFAEVAVGFARIEAMDAALPPTYFARLPLPWEAAFLAAKCFVAYRRRGGERRAPLPDFYIGAHAAVGKMTMLTRDARRYRTYFPGLAVIAPD